ncbi:unnamed protein product [Calypogeia fissa]
MDSGSAATRPLLLYASDAQIWHKVAGVLGMAALALGTYGAHGFKPKDLAFKDVFKTANLYHLVHTAALLGAPLTKRPNLFGGLLTLGIVAFSGSCYTMAMTESRDWALRARIGAFAFIAAWASLLF